MDKSYFWTVILGISFGTLLTKISMFFLYHRFKFSPLVKRGLAYISVAVLPALAIPSVFFHRGIVEEVFGHERLLAFGLATLICYKSKNIVVSLGSGILILFLIRSI